MKVASSALTPPRFRSFHIPVPLRLCLLPAIVFIAAAMAILYGSVSLPAREVGQILLRQAGFPVAPVRPAADVTIIWSLRLPRVVTGLLVGAALATAGAIFQAVLRNPLADPFVIGTSSGAALGVAIAFVSSASFAWLGFGAPQIFAFAGSALAVSLVMFLARIERKTAAMTVLLAGFAVSTLMVAGMWLVAYEGGSTDRLFNWTMGSLGYPGWSQLALVGPVMVMLVACSLFFVRDLNALLLGEDQAAHLGLNTERSKTMLIVVATLMTGLAVSIAGIIGFVGLVVPHLVRLVYGANHRILLPATACVGAAYLCLADLGARTLAGNGGEIPLGILTAVIGAPVFLILLRRSVGTYGF